MLRFQLPGESSDFGALSHVPPLPGLVEILLDFSVILQLFQILVKHFNLPVKQEVFRFRVDQIANTDQHNAGGHFFFND